ncbi:MAG: bifunctional demethylmenaquinone methyltransferase/2-methoxy-6-polyprenyl-1,4-benzoquinol methylase UbiE [Bryobacterales bacterium]|nr:bifunctional demethylmenaquinone methyltransferase/2-methoxy-6-polyprenyl-1,4-benzoquinol methylase UbiE [Bryobacterales bacterium]
MSAKPAHGSTPEGAESEREAARWVQQMFGQVAPRYDLLNHVLSLNIDKRWRAHTVRKLAPILRQPAARAMDLCCGTGDLLVAMEREAGRPLLGSDFCFPMLTAASAKIGRLGLSSTLFDADGLELPLAAESLDLITIAFGFRNFSNYRRGLAELRRVLRPGGTLAILEFSQPPNRLFRAFYGFYSTQVLPRIGGLVSGSSAAYSYLPASVRKFPGAPELREWILEEGFQEVEFDYLSFGIAALHTARK